MYIFDMELPLVLCDLGELLTDYAACLTSCDPADLLHCDVTGCLVSGPADQKWENCMTGDGCYYCSFIGTGDSACDGNV